MEDAGEGGVDCGGGCGGSDDEDSLSLELRLACNPECSVMSELGGEELTVDTMVVTRLPHLEKMAKKPITNSAALRINAIPNDHTIQPDTFLYVSRPFCKSSPSTFCADVSLSSHTLKGSNQNLVDDLEQKVIVSLPSLSLSPSQYDHRPTW